MRDTIESIYNYIRFGFYFPKWHVFNLKGAAASFLSPRLKQFRKMHAEGDNRGIPEEFLPDQKEEWIQILDTMIYAFDAEIDEGKLKTPDYQTYLKHRDIGLRNFAKYYGHLWD